MEPRTPRAAARAARTVLNAVNGSVPFWDGANACVTAGWTSISSAGTDAAFAARDGAHVSAVPQYRADGPSTGQRILGILSEVPAFVLLVGGLVLPDRLLRSAARDGAYTRQTAYRLRFLGWFLLVGSLASETVRAASRAALLATPLSYRPAPGPDVRAGEEGLAPAPPKG